MGIAYVEYVQKHSQQYQLMFGTPLPNSDEHTEMMKNAQASFALLQVGIENLNTALVQSMSPKKRDYDALFICSTLHNMCSIVQSHTLQALNIPQEVSKTLMSEVTQRMGTGFHIC